MDLQMSFECHMIIFLNIINPTNLTDLSDLTIDFGETSTTDFTCVRYVYEIIFQFHTGVQYILQQGSFYIFSIFRAFYNIFCE